MEIFKAVLMMLGGLGAFLVGLKLMGDNLENMAGNKLKAVFNKISNNRFSGVLIGTGATAVIQSSSATTVMVIGFVNAGVMTLRQATSIIMGANIGTTVTAQIVALQSLPITAFFASMACVGAFMMMSKKDALRNIGSIIAGIGIIFVGLQVMSSSMNIMQDNPAISSILQNTKNPFLLLFFGLLITAIVQSSSATTSILITIGGAGLMELHSAMYVTLGINIGTCITAILASIGATTNAKRTSMIHLLFNCFGSFVFFFIVMFTPLTRWLQVIFPNAVQTQIAMFHTLFNVTTTIILLPFVTQITQLSTLIIRDKKGRPTTEEENILESKRLVYIDDRLIGTPSIAMMMTKKEILSMFVLAKQNLDVSVNMITTMDFSEQTTFAQRERRIDYLNGAITKFLVKISSQNISYVDEKELASYYRVLSDIERIGDYAENVVEYSNELLENKAIFSSMAISEIREMKDAIDLLYSSVYQAFENKDLNAENTVCAYEESVDDFKEVLGKRHIERLSKGECPAEAAGVFLSLISNLERVADHMRNVFKSMKSYAKLPLSTKITIKPVERKI